jgi:Spy/CpxP family protein refolding chaperone
MKFAMIAAIAAFTLASITPAFADDNHRDGGHMNDGRMNGGHMMMQHRPMPQRDPHRFHQGQVYNGHHLMYRNGYWGYQQPSNGLFIHINL